MYDATRDPADKVIRIEAADIAKRHKLKDRQRVAEIVRKTAIDANGIRFDVKRNRKNLLEHVTSFSPRLDEALRFMPADKAMDLFEQSDLNSLGVKAKVLGFWVVDDTPFYTLSELRDHIDALVRHLRNNKRSLLSIGYPSTGFRRSELLFQDLSRLYPIKVPGSIQGRRFLDQMDAELAKKAKRDSEGNLIYKYTWVKQVPGPLFALEWLRTRCTYEKAALIPGLSESDVEHIEEMRPKILNLKIKVLGIVHRYVAARIATGGISHSVWDECLKAIAEGINRPEYEALWRIEKVYPNLFMAPLLPDGRLFPVQSQVTGFHDRFEPGGLKNILDFIAYVERELTTGLMDQTRSRFLEITGGSELISYFQLISSPRVDEMDALMVDFLRQGYRDLETCKSFDERIAASIDAAFKCPVLVSPAVHGAVEELARFIEGADKIGIPIAHRLLRSLLDKQAVRPVLLPPGTTWESITIKFVGGNDVRIRVGEKAWRASYKEMGFEDSRKAPPVPNEQWRLLTQLAEHQGQLDAWDAGDPSFADLAEGLVDDVDKISRRPLRGTDAKAALDRLAGEGSNLTNLCGRGPNLRAKKQKSLLAKALKKYFDIDSDPFYPYKQVGAYKIRLKLIPD
jgi:hypothetical protein